MLHRQLPCSMKDIGLCHTGRSFVEVRNEQETTFNRANGNLTIRCALVMMLASETACLMIMLARHTMLQFWNGMALPISWLWMQ